MNIVMPQLGETVTEGTVIAWFKQQGDQVAKDEVLFEIETEKVTMEVPSPVLGTLVEICVPEGETVEVGTVLAIIQQEGMALEDETLVEDAAHAESPPPATGVKPPSQAEALSLGGTVAPPSQRTIPEGWAEQRLSPVVRRLLAEHNLSPDDIQGTGSDGRITRGDVMTFLEGRGAAQTPKVATASPGSKVIPFNALRRNTAKHMVRSKATSPHVLQVVEADFDHVARLRTTHQAAWEANHGFRLTYLPFIARAVCLALGDFPNLNASVEGEGLVVYAAINLSIAVDLNFDGLVAPVVKGAETLSLTGLAVAIQDLITRARDGSLVVDDMTQGTYTLSNAGTFGTLITAPIINQPQVAILSADAISKRPTVVEAPEGDSLAIHPVGMLAQSFDHRAVDGAYSAAYLKRLKEIVETLDWEQELLRP